MRKSNFNTSINKAVLCTIVILSNLSVSSQVCVSSSRNSYEWPGHNNWFLPTWSPSDGSAHVLRQNTGVLTRVVQPDWTNVTTWTTSIKGYQAV